MTTHPPDLATSPIDRTPVGKARHLLHEGETLAEGLRRFVVAEIAAARVELTDPALPRDEAIHRTRRHLKRVRSLFTVLEPVPGADRENRIRRIRDTARLLAGARDANVVAAEARRLHAQSHGAAERAAGRLAERLEAAVAVAHSATPPIEEIAARLRASEASARSLPTRFEAGRLLADALVETYRRGRRDWREIEDGTSVAALHDWRKRVKARRHLSALVPIPTAVTGRSILSDLEQLGEILGEEHDLAVLRHRLEDDPALLGSGEGRDDVLDLVARRRRRLKKDALELGGDLYDLRTRAFAHELEALRELC